MIHYDLSWLKDKYENGDNLKYVFFWGHTNKNNEDIGKICFSQWFESPFIVGNIKYSTAEHWMMAQKALLFSDCLIFDKILNCKKPAEAKSLGRQVSGYDEQKWNDYKFEIVKLGNIHKFNQHPKLAEFLINTAPRILVEASPVDKIWGIGLSQDNKDIENINTWRGENLLGFALMETRDFLMEFGHFSPLKEMMQTPWEKFPNYNADDSFWTSGTGKEYLVEFNKYFSDLAERDKTIFKITNPSFNWTGFYTS